MDALVFPTKYVSALNTANPGKSRAGDVQPLDQAWSRKTSDAHAVGYLPPAGDVQGYRLTKDQVDLADQRGIRQHWLCFDIDRPGHTAWSSLEEARVELFETIDALPEQLQDYAGGYTTRAGLRVVFHLGTPLSVRYVNHLLRVLGERLHDRGILVDPACYQWTRLFRLPLVRRERHGDLDALVERPTTIPGSIHALLGLQPTVESTAAAVLEDMPSAAQEVPGWLLKRVGSSCPEFLDGSPVDVLEDPDNGASMFRAIRTVLARASRAGSITDPALLISLAWASVEASGRDPEEFWKFACWVCAQQEAHEQETLEAPTFADTPPPERSTGAPEVWWNKVSAIGRKAKSKYVPDVLRRMRRGMDVTPSRGINDVPSAFGVLLDIVRGTPLAEDPEVLVAAIRDSWKHTPKKGCTLEDLWAIAKEAAEEWHQIKAARLQDEQRSLQSQDVLERWPLCIVTGNQYFVLDAREEPGQWTYVPVKEGQLVPLMRQMQPSMPMDVRALTSRERGGMISAAEALDGFGRFVDNVQYVSGAKGARFVEGGRVALLPCHRRSEVAPAFNPQVAEWLRLLAGDAHDQLLRWIAAAPKTSDGPLAALYLQGPAGCGKTLLCKGVATLYAGGHVDYNRITASEFNGEVTRSPILFADEGISPVFGKGTASPSIQFRSFVSNGDHVVRQLYTAPVDLRGYLRVMLTANDAEGIPFSETLGKDGIDAIVERVFHIMCQPEAKLYLQNTVTAPVIRETWLKGQALAAHFAWLATQPVEAEGRYIVCGVETEWHRRFVANQGLKPELFSVLGDIAERAIHSSVDGAFVKDGTLYVHKKLVERTWPDVVSGPMPRLTKIARTLNAISQGPMSRARRDEKDERWYVAIAWKDLEDADVLSAKARSHK
ncbi:MAG: P-loop NTPase family protein [Planctomycetota bacterium]